MTSELSFERFSTTSLDSNSSNINKQARRWTNTREREKKEEKKERTEGKTEGNKDRKTEREREKSRF